MEVSKSCAVCFGLKEPHFMGSIFRAPHSCKLPYYGSDYLTQSVHQFTNLGTVVQANFRMFIGCGGTAHAKKQVASTSFLNYRDRGGSNCPNKQLLGCIRLVKLFLEWIS